MELKKDDLISRSAAIGCLGNSPEQMCMPWSEVERMLRELPAVDAVPVARCRDCKWGIVTTDEDCEHIIAYCNNPDSPVWEADIAVPPDWFCADGEQREDE